MGRYTIKMTPKGRKAFRSCPQHVKAIYYLLQEELEEKGPILTGWPNFSRLHDLTYHCHLGYHWVSVWRFDSAKDVFLIEVTYVGSREKAPY